MRNSTRAKLRNHAEADLEREAAHWEIQWFGCLDSVDWERPALCELREVPDIGDEDAGELWDESKNILAALEKWMGPTFYGLCLGRASWRELRLRCERALRWAQHRHDPTRGPFASFARAIISTKARQFHRQYTQAGLYQERRDEDLRRDALTSEAHLAAYLLASEQLIRRAQRAFPRRWHLPGMSDEDVIGELTIRLLEHLKSGQSWEPYERVATAVTLVFCDRLRRALKKRRQIFEITATGFVRDTRFSKEPSPEDLAIAKSTRRYVLRVFEAAATRMSKTQRRWFAGMLADVSWHGELKETRVAAQLEKTRSAACLAKRTLREIIQRELERDPEY